MTQLIQYASLHPKPWKNGGGSTTEIAAAPPGAGLDAFDWRVSLATIAHSGPFSSFPGIDRSLALVQGDGVLLDFGDERFVLSPSEPLIEFAGETPVHATLADGTATIDFNVMTRRARCRHRLTPCVVRGRETVRRRGDTTLLFLADGESLTLGSARERIAMVRYDTVLLGDGEWTLEAPLATVFVVDIVSSGERQQ
ncbi:HutD family protein [Oxalobacteraceae bacterium A2-2]